MDESYEQHDLETLRAIARGQGWPEADTLGHDELVERLRDAGLSKPDGPVQTQADTGTEPGTYHGLGVGRREETGTGDA
jgi:hypothetical protein